MFTHLGTQCLRPYRDRMSRRHCHLWRYSSHLEGSTGLCSICPRPLGDALSHKAVKSCELVSFDAQFKYPYPTQRHPPEKQHGTDSAWKQRHSNWTGPLPVMTIHRYPGTHSLARKYDARTHYTLTDLHATTCTSAVPWGEAADPFDNYSDSGRPSSLSWL